MTDACYYHPDVPAADTCAQCGMRICADCREQISGRSVCHQCVGIMRTRIEREMAAAPPPGTYAGSGPSPASFASVSTPNAPHAGRTAIGIVVGLLIGIVGAIVIEKIGLYGHFTLSYFYIVLGYGIGWGIHQAWRRKNGLDRRWSDGGQPAGKPYGAGI